MNLRLFIFAFSMVAVAIGNLSAQSAPQVKPTPISLRLLAFQGSEKVKEAFIHDPGAPADTPPVTGEIKSNLNDRAVTVEYYSPKIFFTRSANRESVTEKGSLIAEVNLPKNTSSAILLFLPNKADAAASSNVLVVDDSVKKFPVGSYLVANISPKTVRIQLEEKVFTYKPGDLFPIVDPPVQANNHSAMHTYVQEDNEWRLISAGLWPRPNLSRSLLVFCLNRNDSSVNLRAFGDVPPPIPKPAKP